MQKRGRLYDQQKIRKLQITRRTRSDISQSQPSMLCIRMMIAWMSMVVLDALTGFRFELLWPTWMLARAAFDSLSTRNQHCVTTIANPSAARFSVLFVCVTATSDLICYLFIPIRMLIFIATTYVWLNLYCHAQGGFIRTIATLYGGERSQSWSIVMMSLLIIGFELFLRIRITKFDYASFIRSHSILMRILPTFSVTELAGVNPVWTRSLNAFFGAHSIGYPAVLITVSLHYYLNEWKLRRKQCDVSNRNEQLFRILVESLPAEYEGPKDYTTSSQCLEEDLYYLDPPVAIQSMPQAIQAAVPPTATPPTNSRKNGWHKKMDVSSSTSTTAAKKKKNGTLNSTPPNDKSKKTKSLRNDADLEEMDDSDGEDYWRDTSDGERRGGGIWIIRLLCDAASWAFYILFTRSQSTSHNPHRRATDEDDDDETSTIGDEFEKKNGRTDSLSSSMTKSRANTMTSTTSAPPTTVSTSTTLTVTHRSNQNNNTQKMQQKANGKNHHHHHQHQKSNGHSNGHARVSTATVRDSSHDTNGSNDTDTRALCRENESLRSEIASMKNLEEDFRLQISMHESNEARLAQQLSSSKLKNDQYEMKCASLERSRESDKSQLESAERKYAELLGKKAEIEATLSAERKARTESAGKNFDAAEHQRERERQLESEIDKLRAELKTKEETNMKMEGELSALRNYKEENDIEALSMELRVIRDKSHQMEESLAGENKLKQSLFKCLGESRTENKLKDQEIAELKAHLKKLGALSGNNETMINGHTTEANNENDTTASDQSSPHQHSAMGSPVPSAKMPLSVNVSNRGGSPFNEKMSPIRVSAAIAAVAAGSPPPDYMMAVGGQVAPPPIIQKNTIRYNEFKHMPTGGEHRLFDTPTIASAPSPTGSNPDDDFLLNKGKYFAGNLAICKVYEKLLDEK
uniref:Macoilin n=1 Tax=Caenorhabditis japonica TaxID=281687 RepID=A0A8R1DV65_CAEJA